MITTRSADVFTYMHNPDNGERRELQSKSPNTGPTHVSREYPIVGGRGGGYFKETMHHGDVVNKYRKQGYLVERTSGTGTHSPGSGEKWVTLGDGRHVLIR